MKRSILNIKVSCFEKCASTTPADVNLLTWLTSEKYRNQVEQLRSLQDENLQKVIKKSLPAITPGGLFNYRDEKHLIEHSGFLAFDIDFADNTHIRNFTELKEQIAHVVCVAYCGISVRGKGFWGLVPIPKSTPEEHKYRFDALAKFFKGYNVNLDPSGNDVCRLRIYSWDPEGYFNHNAKLYTSILKPKKRHSTRPAFSDTRERVEAIISQIKENKIDITQDYKEEWLKLASALANEFGESGRDYFHTVSQYNGKYNIQDSDRMFDSVLKHDYKITIGSFFKIASDYGIKIQKKQDESFSNASQNQVKIEKPKTDNEFVISRKEVITLPETEKIVKSGIWSNEIAELEQFFSTAILPNKPIKLDKCNVVIDVNMFVNSHLSILKGQNGNERYVPYLDRLRILRDFLSLN